MITRIRRGARDERGAIAILVCLLAVVIFGMAALAVDVSMVTMERQKLHDTVDSAAQSGAYNLPGDGAGAKTAALNLAAADDATLAGAGAPTAELYCVVASKPGPPLAPNTAQIPATCDPGTAALASARCNAYICAIPCAASATTKCNTVNVIGSKVVPFRFAPVIGRNQGDTGSVSSAACKGSCGTEVPNPLDIVIMADRTASMASADRAQMKLAILNSLKTMTPALHHVAFGTLAKSRLLDYTTKGSFVRPTVPATPTYEDCARYTRDWQIEACRDRNRDKQREYNDLVAAYNATETAFSKSAGWDGTGETDSDGICRTEAVRTNGSSAAATRSVGTWLPIDYSNDYLTATGDLVPSSALVDAISCLPESTSGEYGTNIGASLKAAVRKVLGGSTVPNASSRPGTPRKVVIFETDGQPDEVGSESGSLLVTNDEEVWSGQQSSNSSVRNGTNGCNRFKQVATNAKAAGVIVITIGFGGATTGTCERYYDYSGEPMVKDVLAAAASNSPSGGASTAGDCATADGISTENRDGDYFFCATQGDELAEIFKTALNQVGSGIRLIKLP